jgi:short subunit fatty acids transporter
MRCPRHTYSSAIAIEFSGYRKWFVLLKCWSNPAFSSECGAIKKTIIDINKKTYQLVCFFVAALFNLVEKVCSNSKLSYFKNRGNPSLRPIL